MIRVGPDPIDAADLLRRFEETAGGAGAIASFSGKVRGEAGVDQVASLSLEHYPGLTEISISEILEDAKARWNISHAWVFHRTGEILPGETIVFVCAASAHRRDAFEAVDFLMDYLKTRALFWKKEQRETGAIWIEPREQDYKDAARWEKSEDSR